MLSRELEALSTEVESLRQIPAGPRRGAACAQPRRRIWDLLASLSDRLAAGVEGEGQVPAEEVLDSCRSLQELLTALRALDISSRESHWALTDYAALAAELADQYEAATKCLLLDGPADLTVPEKDVSAPAIECPTGANGSVKMKIKDVNDLQLEYPCGWSGDGICERGCMVGGCEFHSHSGVEAW
mmetsp:Transcript_118283/g.368371  ORF Transcript_118283/g.368371 Transcript_118283/m.368371 type:complete len:186 (+) Transcript_118283:61-618(+)